VPPRAFLSEDAEREEREGYDRLRAAESKLRELRGRRDVLLQQVHQLSDEQKALFDSRQPRQDRLEATNDEHRELGRRLAELRRARDQARQRLEEAIVAARFARQELPHGSGARPEQIRREMAQLELRQQTTALPLADENALIDRLRELRRQLDGAEKNATLVQSKQESIRAKEDAVRALRTEVERLNHELETVKVERDRRMGSMRAQLLEVGQLVAQIREKSRQRGQVMERLDTLMVEVRKLEREANELVNASRQRRQEARRTIGDYNREVRAKVGTGSSSDRLADAQLEELLKRGKVVLSG